MSTTNHDPGGAAAPGSQAPGPEAPGPSGGFGARRLPFSRSGPAAERPGAAGPAAADVSGVGEVVEAGERSGVADAGLTAVTEAAAPSAAGGVVDEQPVVVDAELVDAEVAEVAEVAAVEEVVGDGQRAAGAAGAEGGSTVDEAAVSDEESGAADAESVEADVEVTAAADDQSPGTPWWRRLLGGPWGRWRIVGVAGIAVLLLAAGGLRYAGESLRDPGASGNRALTDTGATDQVIGDVSNALSRIFAYTPDDTAATAKAAADLLDGAAATQYQALFAQVKAQVAEQQLTLTTRVVRAGVVTLTADRARLLVFLDQTAQRAGATATSAAAQLSVTARLEGGHWRITDMKSR